MLEVLLINLVISNFPPFNEPEHWLSKNGGAPDS